MRGSMSALPDDATASGSVATTQATSLTTRASASIGSSAVCSIITRLLFRFMVKPADHRRAAVLLAVDIGDIDPVGEIIKVPTNIVVTMNMKQRDIMHRRAREGYVIDAYAAIHHTLFCDQGEFRAHMI